MNDHAWQDFHEAADERARFERDRELDHLEAVAEAEHDRLTADYGEGLIRTDPKPAPRTVATPAQWELIADSKLGPCRGCGERDVSKLALHHLVPRSLGGDDVVPNIAPLCTTCHAVIHDHPAGWEQTAANVRESIDLVELAYCLSKKGRDWLDRYYPEDSS